MNKNVIRYTSRSFLSPKNIRIGSFHRFYFYAEQRPEQIIASYSVFLSVSQIVGVWLESPQCCFQHFQHFVPKCVVYWGPVNTVLSLYGCKLSGGDIVQRYWGCSNPTFCNQINLKWLGHKEHLASPLTMPAEPPGETFTFFLLVTS